MYTPDNVHFFDTKKQLERWVAGQRKQQPPRIQSPQEQTTTTLQTPKRSKLTSFRVFSDDDGSLDFWSEDGNETASFLPTPREIQPTQPTKIKKFNVDDVVIYVSPLTGKEKEGRVIAPRRPAFYRVQPAGEAHVEMVAAHTMEYPQENVDRKMRAALEGVFLRSVRCGFDAWSAFTKRLREEEVRLNAALRLQALFRARLASKDVGIRREQKMMLELQLRKQERVRKKRAKEARKARAIEARKREKGFTADGIHYFFTKAELKAFYRKKEKACKLAMAALERMSSGKMRDAFRTWAHYIFHVLAPPHLDIDGMLADGNLRAEHRQLKGDAIEATIDTEATTGVASMLHERQLQSKIAPWHPACKLSRPGLPSCGV